MKSVVVSKKGMMDLSQKMRQGLADIKKEKEMIKAIENIVFLLDVSGSMDNVVDGRRKIDHLRSVMMAYANNRKVSFSSSVREGEIPEPGGRTDMAMGFRHIGGMIPKPIKVVLISDGMPDNESEAIAEAKKLRVPVDVVYIGEAGSEGEEFMKRLAAETGGSEFTADTREQKFGSQLDKGIAGFLTA